MADAQKTIDLVFNGVDKTGAAVTSALNNTEKFSASIERSTAPFASASAAAVKYEAAILAVGAAFGGLAISEASKFESALAELNKVLGDGEDLGKLADDARQLGKDYGIAAADIVSSLADYKQAGFDTREASLLVKDGLDLVIAGGLEASSASNILVASLKGFGASADEARGFIDLLNQVSNEYATNVEELGTGFAELSPIARNTGFSIQETVAVLTPGIEVYRSGAEAARGLRTSFLNLGSDLPRVQDALSALGVSQRDTNR